MGFGFTVVNLPPVAKYWAARFNIGGQNYWLGILTEEGKFQTYPVAGFVDAFHVFLYDSSRNYLGPSYGKSLYYGITVIDGEDYQFDWKTNQFKGIEKPRFSNLKASCVPRKIRPGDFFYIDIDFDYSGPDIIGATAIKVALGSWFLLKFTEVGPVIIKIINVYGPANSYHYTYIYQVPSDMELGTYDIICQIGNYPWDGTVYAEWTLTKEISVLPPEAFPPPPDGVPPEYELIQHTVYPWVYTFEGDAEVCTFEFKLTPEQIPGTRWLGERIVESFVNKLEEEDSRLLELKVYEDITPTFWTNYRVEVTATASPIAWTVIIGGVLAILFIVAIYFTIKLIDEVFFKRKKLDEETKRTFSRETLTAMILDLEPETPPETLEGESDQELRNLLNSILAEKEKPSISPWVILGLVGGLTALGVGAGVALAKRK